MERVRVDRWLWAARFFKTRGAATEAVLAGRVHVNGGRVKPAKDVRPADTVDVRIGVFEWSVVVTGLAEKRGSATVAATLYDETPDSRAKRERLAAQRKTAQPPGFDLGTRPTKQDRRRIDALRRGQRNRGRDA